MARCADLNCEHQDVIKATTDFAGPGVLFAYIASAVLAILAVVYGYLSDSLPETYLNETDKAVIASFQACLPSERKLTRMRAVYDKIKSFLLLGRQNRKSHHKLTRRQREEVMRRFILQLSDQQLATGLAILIAAVANQCTLTVWEFQLAFALAWFSSTTHLATLDCLREYFLHHEAVRNWRVGGMIALLLMLLYFLIMSMASVDVTIPVQCTFYFFGDQGFHIPTPLDFYDSLSAGLTLVLLIWGYLVRIRWSYKKSDGRATWFERLMFKLRTRRHRLLFRPSKKELEYMTEEAVCERWSFQRRRDLEQIRNSKGLRRHWLIAYRASEAYSRSFLSLGPMLTFMIAFGVTQLYLGRWHSGLSLDVDNNMTIGQITPLFLLVLPPLSAAECYYEVQDSTELAQSQEIAKENAELALAKRKRQMSVLSSGRYPLRENFRRSCESIELRDIDPLDSTHSSEDYEALLPVLKRFFYLETKLIDGQIAALATRAPADQNAKSLSNLTTRAPANQNVESLLNLRAHLVASYYVLDAQETALQTTTLTSLVEFAACIVVSIGLGILLYIQSPLRWTIITSFTLFGLCLLYKIVGLLSYIPESWFDISEADYKRLITEARKRKSVTEYQRGPSRFSEAS